MSLAWAQEKQDPYERFKEELGILKYCDIDYSLPVEGAGIWQSPEVPLILIPGKQLKLTNQFSLILRDCWFYDTHE